MPIQVEIEGKGVVAEFPDGTDQAIIDSAIKRDFFSETPQVATQPSFMDKIKEWAGQSTPVGGGDMPMGLDPMANKQGQLGMAQQALTPAAQGAWQSSQNIGQVLPVADMLANLITSTYGIPISGLAGIAGLAASGGEGGLDRANQWLNATQNALVYKPQTPGGQQLTEAAGAPFEPFRQGGAAAGGKLEEMGYPMAGAAVHSAIEASPLILMRKGKVARQETAVLDSQISQVVRKGVNKGIRPTIVGKSNFKQMEKQYKNYETAIQDIIETNPEKIPQTLTEASKANLDTKIRLWNDATKMSGMAEEAGAAVSLNPVISEMRAIATHPDMIRLNKAGSQKLLEMADTWEALPTVISPMEAEATMANLNTLSKGFWKDPNPNSLGMGVNMERLASILRKELTRSVENMAGSGYADFRKRYGAQAAIEKELANRALVDARKSPSGYFDILDAGTAAEFMHGLIGLNPASMAGAVAIRGVKKYLQNRADPNKIVADMFNKTKDLMDRKKLLMGEQISIPTMAQSFGENTWDYTFMKPALESLENINKKAPMSGLNPSEMAGQATNLWAGVPRPPKQRATLIPKPTLKAPLPKPIPSAETPVNMLEGIPFTPEQLAIMGKRFGPTAREMGMADIIATPKMQPLKAPNPLMDRAMKRMLERK
jgi:hypothetical protein